MLLSQIKVLKKQGPASPIPSNQTSQAVVLFYQTFKLPYPYDHRKYQPNSSVNILKVRYYSKLYSRWDTHLSLYRTNQLRDNNNVSQLTFFLIVAIREIWVSHLTVYNTITLCITNTPENTWFFLFAYIRLRYAYFCTFFKLFLSLFESQSESGSSYKTSKFHTFKLYISNSSANRILSFTVINSY